MVDSLELVGLNIPPDSNRDSFLSPPIPRTA